MTIFWVDTFACPALFSWHIDKSVSRDGVPKSFEFNAEHYATLVAYPAPFHKYPEPFICLIGMSHNYSLDENTYPQFLQMDLLSFIRTANPTKVRVGKRERDEASVDKLFDEGGSGEQGNQGDSAGGGHGVGVQLVDVSAETVAEDVAHVELQRRKKRKTKVVDAGEPSHLAKKLRGDYRAPGVPVVGDSSDPSGVNIAEAEVDSVVRTSLPIMTNATTATPTVYPAAIAKEKLVSASVFGGDSSSADESHPISGYFSDRTGGDFLVGGIRTVIDPDSNLQRVYVPHWNVTNRFCMDDGGVFREMVDEAARQISLGAEYNIKEKRRLKFVVEEKDSLLKSRCDEIKSLKAHLLIKEAKAAEAVRLRDEAQALKERNTYLEKEKSELEIKVTNLAASVKVREQEVADLDAVHFWPPMAPYPWHETCYYQVLHSSEYLSALGAVIEKAIEKGIQDGLAVEITHGVKGRVLADVAAYNPSEEADYFFTLLVKLRSNKDASVDTIMNILRLEDNLAERLGLTESQPCVDQLMVPIHHSPNRVVVGATSLSFALDVSDARVRKIRENIAFQRPALRDVFTPISEPFSAEVIISPISTDDYEIAHTEGGEDAVTDVEAVADEGADPFPDVSGAELDASE
nr:hypothetical protein [Tanacetum cinerariifolium]